MKWNFAFRWVSYSALLCLFSFNLGRAAANDEEVRAFSPERLEVQQTAVNGQVSDASGRPMLGVNVIFKGTQVGTVTDADGRFDFSEAQVSSVNTLTLVFSYLGYTDAEMPAGENMNVVMREQVQSLSDVVVVAVGYESQNKRELSSAVVTTNAATITKQISNTPDQLLQGRLPGLQVRQNSGQPGNTGVSLLVRGPGTFSGAGNNPLVIIDGLPGDMNRLNPNDIKDITVLKDAASAAIYGSRGANGVIVITTKTGEKGRFNLSVDSNLSIQRATTLPDVVTNSAEYMQLSNEARSNVGLNPYYTPAQIELFSNPDRDKSKYPDTNWLDTMFTTALVQNHYIGISGTKENTGYNVGLGLADQPGVFNGFNYKKYTLKFNLNSKINKVFELNTSNLISYDESQTPTNGAADQFLSALSARPMVSPEVDGRFIGRNLSNATGFALGNKNPVAMYKRTKDRTNTLFAQINLGLNIHLAKGLTLENKGGVNFWYNNSNIYRALVPLYDQENGVVARNLDVGTPGLEVRANRYLSTSFYSILKYDTTIANVHRISAYVGRQQDGYYREMLSASRQGYEAGETRNQLNVGAADTRQANSGTAYQWTLVGYYGHLKYVFNEKYIIDGNIRYDGSSRFNPNNRWGAFYSGSAAWRISQESFMPKVDWLNDLKIRGSYGELGNQNINRYDQPYLYQNFLDQGTYSFNDTTTVGYTVGDLVDPTLTWEKTSMLNFALEGSLFNNRLYFSFDYYTKRTTGILRTLPVPDYLGRGAPISNAGAMENRGFEAQVTYNGAIGKDFKYSVTANADGYKNKLTRFEGVGGNLNNSTFNEVGREYDSFYLYTYDGIFQNQQEADNAPDQTSVGFVNTPGFLRLKDVNRDGAIDLSDRQFIGGRYPNVNYSLSLSASWKDLDAAIFFYGSQGQKMYITGWGAEPFRQESVPTTDWRNRWTPENPSRTMPKIYVADNANGVSSYRSTYFLRDASFLRIKNINIGYSFERLLKKANIHVDKFRVYTSIDNIYTFSNINGLDPERTGVSGNFVIYPQVTSYAIGCQISF